MSELDQILKIDSDNVEKTKRLLAQISPDSIEAIEVGTKALNQLGKVWGEQCKYDQYNEILELWGSEKGVSGNELLGMLKQATLIGPPPSGDSTADAKVNLDKATAVLARTYLILRLQRDFLFGMTDLLRLRITPALGYLRIQAETVGILKLLSDSPHIAQEWLNADIGESGKKFFNKHNRKVIKSISDLNLYDYYNRGSSLALHSRVGGVTAGLLIGDKNIAHPGIIQLNFQETDSPTVLFLWFCAYLRFHKLVLDQVNQFVPELDSDAIERVGAEHYGQLVDQLLKTLEPMYREYRKHRFKRM